MDNQMQNTEENDWTTGMKLSYDYNAYVTEILNTLLEVQDIGDGHLGQIGAAKHIIELNLAGNARSFRHHTQPAHAHGSFD